MRAFFLFDIYRAEEKPRYPTGYGTSLGFAAAGIMACLSLEFPFLHLLKLILSILFLNFRHSHESFLFVCTPETKFLKLRKSILRISFKRWRKGALCSSIACEISTWVCGIDAPSLEADPQYTFPQFQTQS
jgi:hypothetical protein